MDIEQIKFDEKGLIPAIAQEEATGEVLMLAYMNKESLKKTIATGKAYYYSRSRQELWLKGGTSGNLQEVHSIRYDCDCDTLLLKIHQNGVACHTGERSCFYRKMAGLDNAETSAPTGAEVITSLYKVLLERKGQTDDAKSYVASLYAKGTEKIADKIAEESGELIEAALEKDNKEVVYELCDLWFHTLVMLGHKDVNIGDVYEELARRFGLSGIEEKKSRKKN
ncbi:Phosphoribosyl-AMP cyclohydrolase / Phosphoribosyl-ATP pyrophosphatase [hydrothermal vent metagenome]|uniref:Histidine biosynthesis bifunctional protein HisIE n=1 Tax=hydrothermal vent metagenome TaxID=652676 RepID=A0A3B0QRY3_9ZZZZ